MMMTMTLMIVIIVITIINSDKTNAVKDDGNLLFFPIPSLCNSFLSIHNYILLSTSSVII